jgi:hypothetical protein
VLICGEPKRLRGGGFPLTAFRKRVTIPCTLLDLGGVRALMTRLGQLYLRCPIVAGARDGNVVAAAAAAAAASLNDDPLHPDQIRAEGEVPQLQR